MKVKLIEIISGYNLKLTKNQIWGTSLNIKCAFRIWKLLGRLGLFLRGILTLSSYMKHLHLFLRFKLIRCVS